MMNETFLALRPSFDPSDLSAYQLQAGDEALSFPEFLNFCAASLIDPHSGCMENRRIAHLRDVFLDAGLSAVKRLTQPMRWLQAGLAVGPGGSFLPVYRQTAIAARELLAEGLIRNFFFLSKPPGFRLRFELSGDRPEAVRDDLRRRLNSWRDDGVFTDIVAGVYEPEEHLFGGHRSMDIVHELFTIDSLAWLDFHTYTGANPDAFEPAWTLSLVMLRMLHAALGVSGWEDMDVWDRVRRKTGRTIPMDVLEQLDFSSASAGLQEQWDHYDRLLDNLSPQIRSIAEQFGAAAGPLAERWLSEYFHTPEAYIGPRDALAFFTIFHWNRAGLSMMRQALIAEALAGRERY